MRSALVYCFVFVGVCEAAVAGLFVPQGSDEQILDNPLAKGEVAYVNGGSGESFVYVGTDERLPNRVADKSALRGYEMYEVDREKFVVLPITNLTRNASSDTLEFDGFTSGVTNTFAFSFVVPHGIKFNDVSFDSRVQMNVGSRKFPKNRIQKIVSDNVVKVVIKDVMDSGIKLTVSNFKVSCLNYGDPDYVNDLTKKKIVIHDTASEDTTLSCMDMELGKWRRSLLHYYDGNRGEDWAKYKADANVRMVDKEIKIGHSDKGLQLMSVGVNLLDTNKVTVSRFGRPMVEYYSEADTSGATDVRFLSITPDETTVSFTLSVSNAVFNANLLKLYTTKELAGNASKWTQIPFTVTSSANPITIQAAKQYNESSFYRISYGNSHVVVHVTDTLKVDRLLLKGDNGSYYRIGVNASGVLTATVVQ